MRKVPSFLSIVNGGAALLFLVACAMLLLNPQSTDVGAATRAPASQPAPAAVPATTP